METTMQIFSTTIIILLLFFTILITAQDSLFLYSTYHGENHKDQFGVVENVGDVNGDGFEDLLVGAPAAIVGTETDGYAKLYFGGATFDTLADRKFEIFDEQIISFGSTIVGKGDLNGDGYYDFAIADYMYGTFQVGKVFVYFGGTKLDSIPDLEFTLTPFEYFYTRFGLSMAMDGDINHDGYDDLVIGAPYDDRDRHGEVFIYYGGPNMDNIADLNLICKTPLQIFGIYIDYIGDVNEDFFDDLLIGSIPLQSDTTTYIFFGNNKGNFGFQNSYAFTKPIQGIVTGLDDVNGDGYNDFSIGSNLFAAPIINNHFSEIIINNPDSIDFSIKARCPDLNKDGYYEIINNYNNSIDEKVFVAFGGNEVSLDDAIVINDPDDKTGFGRFITSFNKLIEDSTISIVIGDTETYIGSDIHGTGKVIIYSCENIVNVIYSEINSQNPNGYHLFQNYPNPFNPSTTIKYSVPKVSNVKIQVYNMMGQLIKTLVNETKAPGFYNVLWNGTNESNSKVASGIYFYRLESDNFVANNKMILIK